MVSQALRAVLVPPFARARRMGHPASLVD
jgi:hypothetical protein